MVPELAVNTAGSVCMVVDVFRATTVIDVLFSRGCRSVTVAASHDEARSAAARSSGILCGETAGLKPPGFHFGNSPEELSTEDFTDRHAILSTTNGTRAVAAASSALLLVTACFRNARAAARHCWDAALTLGAEQILIICASGEGTPCLEDSAAAGLLIEELTACSDEAECAEPTDSAVICRRIWAADQNVPRSLMEASHAAELANAGLGADFGWCSAVNTSEIVPVLDVEGSAARWPLKLASSA
ncbi:MAG: 2-phosphosulfolactate phosphatase [Armatimonadetes bacterium]|nr:2-phosphosulfolactate phosphatase [Armatimonadota bacterium]MDE2207379.1 2-phosphosulfolactate phosphatase [Armatimonadota bacterium]